MNRAPTQNVKVFRSGVKVQKDGATLDHKVFVKNQDDSELPEELLEKKPVEKKTETKKTVKELDKE